MVTETATQRYVQHATKGDRLAVSIDGGRRWLVGVPRRAETVADLEEVAGYLARRSSYVVVPSPTLARMGYDVEPPEAIS